MTVQGWGLGGAVLVTAGCSGPLDCPGMLGIHPWSGPSLEPHLYASLWRTLAKNGKPSTVLLSFCLSRALILPHPLGGSPARLGACLGYSTVEVLKTCLSCYINTAEEGQG